MVRVPAPRVTWPPLTPPPASDPIVWFVSARSRVTPEVFARVKAELLENAPAAPARRVPPFTVVAPL